VRNRNALGWMLTTPYLFFTGIFFSYPFVWSFILLFHKGSIVSRKMEFVGLSNLQKALQSPKVLAAFMFTYKFMLIFIPAVVLSSLFIALLINSLKRGKVFFSLGFFLPYVSSGVAMSIIVRGLLSWTSPLSGAMRSVFGRTPDWFGEPFLAVLIIALMVAWKHSGYYALIFLAGLQSIPKEYYEVAKIDGAKPLTRLRSITIPMLYPAFSTVLILAVGVSFQIFAEPLMLTGGGPHYATHTWQLEIYFQAFEFGNLGYGTTIAMFDAGVTFLTVLVFKRIMQIWGKKHGWI